MAVLSPIKFAGLSVIGLRSSLGWNGGQSRLEVQLVQAPGDTPNFPTVGTPVYAQLGSYIFGGLLQRVSKDSDARGGETYSAYCLDPREILRNSWVILGGYSGPTSTIPNLLNPYGAIESAGGFGASGATEAGMEWIVVRAQTLLLINGAVSTAYGGPLTYKGYSYGLDLSAVPSPPSGYRVGPGLVNLLTLVEDVARDAGRDLYCDLVGTTIRVRTADRTAQPPLGLVEALVESYRNSGILVHGSFGTEDAAGEPSSAFLIGGEKTTLHQTDGLRSFWGYRPDGEAIVGQPAGHLWVGHWLPGIAAADKIDVELPPSTSQDSQPAAALVFGGGVAANDPRRLHPENYMEWIDVSGRQSLWAARWREAATAADRAIAKLPNPRLQAGEPAPQLVADFAVPDPGTYMQWVAVSSGHEVMRLNALPVADVIGQAEYECSTLEMRYAMADVDSWLEYLQVVRPDVYRRLHAAEDIFPQVEGVLHNVDVIPDGIKRAVVDALAVAGEGENLNRERLYQFVRAYGEQFYGVQWLVPLPFVSTALDQDTLQVTYTAEPTNLGWAEEGSGPLGLDLINEDLFTDPSGRFGPFVAFDADGADLSESGGTEGSVYEGDTFYSKCQLSDGIVFSGGNPYALVQTEGFADQKTDALGGIDDVSALHLNVAAQFIQSFFLLDLSPNLAPARRTPLAAAIPLRSNVLTYGPWQSTQGAGRVDARQDSSFVPWNYGGEAAMALAALAAVSTATSDVRSADAGTVEVVGLPLASLGETLESGPLLTDVSVQYGVRGVTTTYQWGTFTPRPGVLGKQFVDRLRQNSVLQQQARRTLRAASRDANRNRELSRPAGGGRRFNDGVVKAVRKNTPHDVLVAHSHQDPDGRVRQQVVSMTAREAVPAIRPDSSGQFAAHALSSWNGLLRPVTTSQSGTAPLSRYAAPSGTIAYGITSNTLNPYGSGNDTDALAYGQSYQSIKSFRTGGNPGDCRPIVLKAPLVLTGWGRTTDHEETNPGPSGLARPDLFKTGPLDPLWDKDRGVWSVHGGAVGVTDAAIPAGGSGTLLLWDGRSAIGSRLTVHDWLGQGVGSGVRSIGVFDARSERWYAVPPGSGSSPAASGVWASDHGGANINTDAVWTDTTVSVSLVGVGTHLLSGHITISASLNFSAAGDRGLIIARLYDVTGADDIDGSYLHIWDETVPTGGGGTPFKSVTTGFSVPYTTLATPRTVRLEVFRFAPTPSGSYGSVSVNDQTGVGANASTILTAVKIA